MSDRYIRFYGPILDSLRELGGSATPREVKELAATKVNLSESELTRTLKSGGNAVDNEIAWARDYLRRLGLIDGSVTGVWRLTQEGETTHLTIEQARALRTNIYRTLRSAVGAPPESDVGEQQPSAEVGPAPDGVEDLLQAIYSLPPSGFERLCQRILREAGFEKVEVTGKSGDGGIDGRGILQLNELVSFRVMFQCKRYKGSVGAGDIRSFQAALMGRADKGIVLTTGTFTRDAEKEATREGGMPVELVDNQKLTRLMERLGLGVRPRTVYDVDARFFDQFRT